MINKRISVFLVITFILSFINLSVAQNTIQSIPGYNSFKSSGNMQKLYSGISNTHRTDSLKENLNINTGSRKSPGLAFLYSLLVPGMGQLYAHRIDVGKYYMISEAALWLGFTSFTIYGNWLRNDAHNYATVHAGIDQNGKDDNFFVNISNYNNVYEYNNDQLQNGRYSSLYDPQNGYYFYWDNTADREKYRKDQLAGDRVITDRLFFVGAIIVNHLISAVSAVFVTNSYNDQLKGSNGGFGINADVIRYGSRVDGIRLNLTKWF